MAQETQDEEQPREFAQRDEFNPLLPHPATALEANHRVWLEGRSCVVSIGELLRAGALPAVINLLRVR